MCASCHVKIEWREASCRNGCLTKDPALAATQNRQLAARQDPRRGGLSRCEQCSTAASQTTGQSIEQLRKTNVLEIGSWEFALGNAGMGHPAYHGPPVTRGLRVAVIARHHEDGLLADEAGVEVHRHAQHQVSAAG